MKKEGGEGRRRGRGEGVGAEGSVEMNESHTTSGTFGSNSVTQQ